MIIGITGSIATGKSTVTNYLKKLGYQIVDSDEIVHQQFSNPEIKQEIVKAFGSDLLINNEINRKKLGKIIFNDENQRKKLNSILHPQVIQTIESLPKNQGLIFVDVPLLFEVKLEYLFDKIIVVYLSYQSQLFRLMKRDQISEEYAKIKIASQMDIEIKSQKADYIINNENSIENTYRQIDDLLRRLHNEI